MKDEDIMNIEREALERIHQIRQESGLSETELGLQAFPSAKNPRLKVSSMRNTKGKTGEPLRFRLGDFCAMCQALGKNPAQELLLILGKINPE